MSELLGHATERLNTGITDQALVLMGTKDLNKLLKTEKLAMDQSKKIKSKRRTLKNRGYAANCRFKTEKKYHSLEAVVRGLQNKSDDLDLEIEAKTRELEHICEKYEKTLRLAKENPNIRILE